MGVSAHTDAANEAGHASADDPSFLLEQIAEQADVIANGKFGDVDVIDLAKLIASLARLMAKGGKA